VPGAADGLPSCLHMAPNALPVPQHEAAASRCHWDLAEVELFPACCHSLAFVPKPTSHRTAPIPYLLPSLSHVSKM